MKKDSVMRRLAAALICLLVVSTVLSVFPPYPLAAPALAAEESSPQMPVATPSEEIYDEDEQPLFFDIDLATGSEASPSEATPSEATPSEASRRINLVDAPDLVALDAGEADQDTWQSVLPQRAWARNGVGEDVWCDLKWSVPYVKWDEPGVYSAQVEVIPPDGYTIEEPARYHTSVVSIHPPGTYQVIDVYARMRIHFMPVTWHTWTFSMKAGQDMTPLKETLENITFFIGNLDDRGAEISFTAEWDFSSVDPTRPGIYPIYRSLTLVEESLPDGVRPEDIYLPEYWKNLPVLFSVEEPGGPQLYGALENPYDFFGSYAKLSVDELSALEVFYSINGGDWIPQTNEGLMDVDERNFYIHKDAMEEGTSYAFRLKLGNHVSRALEVKKGEAPPVWFTSTVSGNRDGTIEVEFPPVSQPPPMDPTGGETVQPPTDSSGGETEQPPTDSNEGETEQPPTDSNEGETEQPLPTPPPAPPSDHDSNDDSERSDSGNSGNGSGVRPGQMNGAKPTGISKPSVVSVPGEGNPQLAAASVLEEGSEPKSSVPEEGSAPKAQPESYRSGSQENRPTEESRPGDTGGEEIQETDEADKSVITGPGDSAGSRSVPEEVVTRWTTQISGKRVQKLIELYPNWILFQKEEVSVLLSSQWLKDQQMRDSDVLTVSVSPEEDHTVTILINQKEPETPPVFQITVEEKLEDRHPGAAATAAFSLGMAGAIGAFLWRRRWRA